MQTELVLKKEVSCGVRTGTARQVVIVFAYKQCSTVLIGNKESGSPWH